MTSIFIAGSRRLSHLNAEVKRRIDTMVEKRFMILVGDANGADKAVQRHLAERGYGNVIVYCMVGNCRNNLGGWQAREIAAPPGAKGFAFYSAKDLAMVEAADYGFMLWDGESKGTLNDVIQMARRGKPVVVYLAPRKTFASVRTEIDLPQLLADCDPAVARHLDLELPAQSVKHRVPAAS